MSKPAPSPTDSGTGGSRYELLAKIAAGGMATVYVGRLRGSAGFSRTVAIKRAHPHLIEDPLYKAMLVDEAHLASRLHHPNVVAVLDVEELGGELSLVMDYVEGAALSDLTDRGRAQDRRLPARIAVRVALDACAGLHAAHELCDEDGKPLRLVHRDVSPHNILVGLDGMARLSDFGIAKHADGGATTTGVLKGKLSYMAPEYVENNKLDARSDVFSLGVVVWEALADKKLFRGATDVETFKRVIAAEVPPLSTAAPAVGDQLNAVLATALARAPADRFETAQAFGTALEAAARKGDLIATAAEVGAYVRELCGAALEERRADVRGRTAPITPEVPTRIVKRAAPPEETPGAPSAARDRPTMPDATPSSDAVAEVVSEAASGVERRSNVTSKKKKKKKRDATPEDRTPPSATLASPATPAASGGGRTRGVLALALAAAAAGGIGLLAMRSGGEPAPRVAATAGPTAAPVTPPAPTVPAAVPTPAVPRVAPTVAASATSAPAPSASASATRPAGTRAPGRARAGEREPVTVDTGVPLNEWPAKPAPEADPYPP